MATAMHLGRPSFVRDEHLEYLDELFESYSLDMKRAVPLLETAYRLDKPVAEATVAFWEDSFGRRLST